MGERVRRLSGRIVPGAAMLFWLPARAVAVEAARVEAQRLVEGARAQLESDVRRARDELRRQVGELATAIAEKLIRKSLRDEDHRRIVAEAVHALDERSS